MGDNAPTQHDAEDLIQGRDFYDDGYSEEEQALNNRIIFSPEKFFGRKQELLTLHEVYRDEVLCYDSPSSENSGESSGNSSSRSPVVIVDGFSGTGKSTLVRRFMSELAEDYSSDQESNSVTSPSPTSTGLYCCSMQGKFENLQNVDPFSAVIEAITDFCQSLLLECQTGNSHNFERIRKAINESLGAETAQLAAFVPALGDLLRAEVDTDDEVNIGSRVMETENEASTGDSWNRLRYLFGKLFQAICCKERPVIMFLDDLQWADEASLELVSSLIEDESLHYFLFIGAMRGNEVDKNGGAPSKFLKEMNDPSRKFVRIELLNLSMDDIGEFVSDTLNMSVDETHSLTEVVYGKTRGNIFYSMQTLEELQRRNVLYFSMITFGWEWNLTGVEFDNALSTTVIETVASKIQSMPERLQRALVIAAYTRSTIDVDTLKALMVADGQDVTHKELVGLLDMAVLEGLLKNTVGSIIYRFGHDRIKEAAYWMVPSGQERDKLRVMIGKNLVPLAKTPEGGDWMLFVAADHLNSCRGHGKDDLSLAELNLLCGQKASKLAAFVPASLYLRLSLKYLRKLGENHWTSHYKLSLRVYRDITNTELCVGNFESGNNLGHQLIDNATSLDDRLPTYLALAVAKGRQKRHAEAFTLCQEALLRLDAIPSRMRVLKMLRDFQIVKRLLRRHSDQEILMLPICQDKRKTDIMDFFTEYAFRAYNCGYVVEFMYAVVRRIRISFKYGLARGSANAFASFGLYLQGPGKDHEGALRMARLAREMMNRTERFSKSTNCLTLLVIAAFLEPWTFPRERTMETLQHAHRIGMASGNIEIAFQNRGSCAMFAQVSGYPLEAVEKAGEELKQQLRLYHVDSTLDQFEQFELLYSHLLGRKEVNWGELEPTFESGEKEKLYRNIFAYLSRLELGVLFGNYEFAVRMSTLLQPIIQLDGSYVGMSKEHFFSSLAYCGLARETRNRKYVSQATKFAKRLRTKGTNTLHKCLLVDAEILSFRCDSASRLITAYDNAIHAASQTGYIHDAALACELAGNTMLDLGEENRGYRYLNQARDLWREYEAHSKVNLLVKTYGRRLDVAGTETSRSDTVADHYHVSSDFSESHRKSLDLTLLSGAAMKTDVMRASEKHSIVSGAREISRDKQDEVSILSDPSSVGIPPHSSQGRTAQSIAWSRQ